jgi:D-serine deaminase-like pyridoxal phosphate-dependent protein
MITPYVRYRVSSIQENAAAIRDTMQQASSTWAPFLSGDMPPTILQTVASLTAAASCRTIDDAESLAPFRFQNLILTQPLVDPLALKKLAKLAQHFRITALIDHFRHAELLSHSLTAEPRNSDTRNSDTRNSHTPDGDARNGDALIDVLIAVDSGQQSIGVRPGPDSVLLAAAAQRLRGIRFRGVFIDDHLDGPFEETVAVARHCQRIIERSGIECPDIVTGLHHASTMIGGHGVTTFLGSPLMSKGVALKEIVCRVISRPSLEWCVIDAGSRLIGDAHQSLLFQPPGARIVRCRPDESTVSLTGASLDLRIGDEVTIVSNAQWQSLS